MTLHNGDPGCISTTWLEKSEETADQEMTVAVYTGIRENHHCVVTVDGAPLRPRLDLNLHASSVFDWGHIDSSSAQLALALLCHHCGTDLPRALNCYLEFHWRVIEALPHPEWTLTSEQIDHVLIAIEAPPESVVAVQHTTHIDNIEASSYKARGRRRVPGGLLATNPLIVPFLPYRTRKKAI